MGFFCAVCAPASAAEVVFSPPAGSATGEQSRCSLSVPGSGRPAIGAWFSAGGDSIAAPLRLARWKDAADFVLTPLTSDDARYCRQAGTTWGAELDVTSAPAELDAAQTAADGPFAGWSLVLAQARGPSAKGIAAADCQALAAKSQQLAVAGASRDIVTALPDPWTSDEDTDFLPCYGAASAAGVALWTGRTWEERPESQEARGLRILRAGDAVRMELPSQPATVFAEWSVTLPPSAHLKFGYRAGDAGGDGVKLGVRVLAALRPEAVWEENVPPRPAGSSGFQQADVDLSKFGESRVRLRLEASPGDARNTLGDAAEWEDPMLVAPAGEASLIEHANWWQMRAGYRPPGEPKDVVTGVTESSFDPAGAELKLGLIRARGTAAGKPFLLNGVHPTGHTGTASPLSLARFWSRVLPYMPASVVFYRAGAQESGAASQDIEPMVSELARWRSFLQLTRPYDANTSTRPVALFVSPESGRRLDGARALEPFGMDIRTLRSITDSVKYRSVIVWAEYLNSESGAALSRFLREPAKGARVILFCGSMSGPGADEVLQLLPFRFAGSEPREALAALPGGASLPVLLTARPSWSGAAGWEAIKSADGETLAAARGGILLVAGLPLARPEGTDNALAQIASQWLGVQPYNVLDSGFVKVVRGDARAAQEGMWLMEGTGSFTVAPSYVAYDLIERQAASATVSGPACLYVFPKRGARIVDPGVCLVREHKMEGTDILARVHCPASLTDADRYQIIFWTPKTPAPSLESGGAWTVSVLGGGFWKAECTKPGDYALRIAGAMLPKPPATWSPADH